MSNPRSHSRQISQLFRRRSLCGARSLATNPNWHRWAETLRCFKSVLIERTLRGTSGLDSFGTLTALGESDCKSACILCIGGLPGMMILIRGRTSDTDRTEQEHINVANQMLRTDFGHDTAAAKKHVDKYIRGPAYDLLQGPPSTLFPGGWMWRVGYDADWGIVEPL